ncbi:hypothetical protein BJX61DRAFT_495113 [Aspergillus egyptiacus]|nr:hypothetical protein BJX61DRAFT_495113 [Aspergillus egyptiacus]
MVAQTTVRMAKDQSSRTMRRGPRRNQRLGWEREGLWGPESLPAFGETDTMQRWGRRLIRPSCIAANVVLSGLGLQLTMLLRWLHMHSRATVAWPRSPIPSIRKDIPLSETQVAPGAQVEAGSRDDPTGGSSNRSGPRMRMMEVQA